MKKKIFYLVLTILFAFAIIACEKMEDNYSNYLENNVVYSPKVRNLEINAALREITLSWDNPAGDVAKNIFIDYEDDTIRTETMIEAITLRGLEIKGYTISVYTVDAFNNYSIPASVTAFPNGEEN